MKRNFLTALMMIVSLCFLGLNTIQNMNAENPPVLEEGAGEGEDTTGDNDVKLILIGVVMHSTSQTPVGDILVNLEDNIGNTVQEYTTKEDGQFNFKLKSDRQYTLYHLGQDGERFDSKIISTVGKNDPEILYAMLEGPRSEINNDEGEMIAVFESKKAESKASSIRDVYEDDFYAVNELIFKIQVGVYKTPPKNNSDFVKGLKNSYHIERTSNGWVRYLVGQYSDAEEAKRIQRQLVNDGYTKAFIVPYLRDGRLTMSVDKALKVYGNH